ncbi:MAG TPA: GNAT family N-acetyltransferase [Deltaproteobacteria bacterium]|nr:GNAT family N-acetyltransferase [Deltaproteobacteria bacterium]
MRVELIESCDGLKRLSGRWNELLEESGCANIFLTEEWVWTWWECFGDGKRLYIITVYTDEGELVGIAPFLRHRVRTCGMDFTAVGLLGSGDEVSPDYLDIIVRKNMSDKVAEEVAGFLLGAGKRDWDLVALNDVLSNSIVMAMVKKMADSRGLKLWDFPHNACPYIRLPDTWDEYSKSISGKKRYEMRRRLKLLKKDHRVEFVRLERREDVEDALSTFFSLHSGRWEGRGKKGMFDAHNNVMAFHRKVAPLLFERNWLRIFFLKVDGKPVAALYGFEYDRRLFHYNAGYDISWSKFGVAKQLIAFVIEESIVNGLVEFDFLKGEEPYKYDFTKTQRQLFTALLWSDSLKGRLHRVANGALRKLKGYKRQINT